MGSYTDLKESLVREPCTWLVTGCAGFIGSHVIERLLSLGQAVRGLDDLSTGFRANLDDVHATLGDSAWERFRFMEGDIAEPGTAEAGCDGVDQVVHLAALGSVPRSVADPLASHRANVDGFIRVLDAARRAGVQRTIYASSSSVYGDHPALPKREEAIGTPLSPYAATKRVNEIYAAAYARAYGLQSAGMRFFNVFGPRQDPQGAYAAVVPRWIDTLARGERPSINGDGETSRDFCPVADVVQAILLASVAPPESAAGHAYNVGLGSRTTLNELFELLREGLCRRGMDVAAIEPIYGDFRAGDVRHSLADISAAKESLDYEPEVTFADGLALTLDWFVARAASRA